MSCRMGDALIAATALERHIPVLRVRPPEVDKKGPAFSHEAWFAVAVSC
jgi:hypothetical protein